MLKNCFRGFMFYFALHLRCYLHITIEVYSELLLTKCCLYNFPTIWTTLLLVFSKIICPITFSRLTYRAKYCSYLSVLLLHPGVWGFFSFCLDFGLVGWVFLIKNRWNHNNQSLFIQTFILKLVEFWKDRQKKIQFSHIMNSSKKNLLLTIGWTIINTTSSKQYARSCQTHRMQNGEE